jgi:hypothetical protein
MVYWHGGSPWNGTPNDSSAGTLPFYSEFPSSLEPEMTEIRFGDDLLDAVQITGPDGIKQHFILIGIELAHREAAASGQPAECVGNPW